MRTGLWFPISEEMLGIAFLIVLVGAIIYAFVYWARKSSYEQEVRVRRNKFEQDEGAAHDLFGFPAESSSYFPNKIYNELLGYVIQRTSGRFGVSLCIHSRLDFIRFYFFVDYQSLGSVQALVDIWSVSDESNKYKAKIVPKSSMFMHEYVRYYVIPMEVRDLLVSGDAILSLGAEIYELSAEERGECIRAAQYVSDMPENEKNCC